MKINKTTNEKTYVAIGALITWFAIIGQLYITLNTRQTDLTETFFRFFGFFTILSNILVATTFTAQLLGLPAILLRPKSITAIAVFITIVGLTYNIILRGIWSPQGLQRMIDETLHVIVPIIFILYWLIFTPKEKYAWLNALTWLWFPAIYLSFTLIRGSFAHYYPYPFIDVDKLGYHKALINSAMVCLAFVVVSIIFITIGRTIAAKNKNV